MTLWRLFWLNLRVRWVEWRRPVPDLPSQYRAVWTAPIVTKREER